MGCAGQEGQGRDSVEAFSQSGLAESNAWEHAWDALECVVCPLCLPYLLLSLSLSLFLSLSVSLSLSLCKRGENDAWSGGKETGEQAEASKRRRVSVGAVVARNRHQSSGCAPACGQGGRAGRMRSPAAASCPPRRHPAAGGMPCRGCSSWPSLAPLAALPICSSDSVSLPLSPSPSPVSVSLLCASFLRLSIPATRRGLGREAKAFAFASTRVDAWIKRFARGAGGEWLAEMSQDRVAYMLVAGLAGGCLGALSEWADGPLPYGLQMALDGGCRCLHTRHPMPLTSCAPGLA